MKKQIVLFAAVLLLLAACVPSAQNEPATPLPDIVVLSPTPPPIIELPVIQNHVDVLGVWNAIEAKPASKSELGIFFAYQRFEFFETTLVVDDYLAIDYEWLNANRQVWRFPPGFAALAISVAREGNILTLTLYDGYIKLQQ